MRLAKVTRVIVVATRTAFNAVGRVRPVTMATV
jgi:hypothetical protein